MDSHLKWANIKKLTMVLMAIGLFSCDGYSANGASLNTATNSSPNPTASTSNGGITCGTNAFCVNVVPPAGTTMILHQDGNFSQPCSAQAGTDMACILEADELDLYAQGMSLNYNVPTGMCSYMRMQPYFYYQYQPGIGPTQVTITTPPSGTPVETDSNDGIPTSSNANQTKTIVSGYTSTTATCSADYTSSGGPNCCGGSYSLTLTTPATSPSTSPVTTVSTQSWGGNPNNCLVGPGVDSQIHETGSPGDPRIGYPEASLFTLDGVALNKNYVVQSPLTKGYVTNAYIANFWQSGTTGYYPLLTTGPTTGAPNAIQGPNVIAGSIESGCQDGPFCTGNPWYEFVCEDPASDYVARIRVMVRSWTSDVNFRSFIANQTNLPANGTYNLYGNEPAPFSEQPIEDLETWVTPDSALLGAGTAGAVNSTCYNSGIPLQKCGFGSMYPGLGN
jgi:hypothetical protein